MKDHFHSSAYIIQIKRFKFPHFFTFQIFTEVPSNPFLSLFFQSILNFDWHKPQKESFLNTLIVILIKK